LLVLFRTKTDNNISEASKVTLRKWQKIVRNKYKNENYKDDKLFKDPLLLVEWNDAGIQARTANNAQFTKGSLITYMYINITSQHETLYKANV
jgi:hypothetical protein